MPANPDTTARAARLGLLAGPLLAIAVFFLLPGSLGDAVLSPAARATAAVATLMACWWLTEALPLPATSLLPILLFPLLDVMPIQAATAPYASDVIFLFMGGFILGLAMQRWQLHIRIALNVVLLVGTSPARLVGGFMLATALLSMWISNTAATIMLLPVATSVITMLHARRDDESSRQPDHFAMALLLGTAYGASIGGMASLIGSPPNIVFANFMSKQLGVEISMLDWFGYGLPLAAVFLPLAWWYLTRIAQPISHAPALDGDELLRRRLAELGPVSSAEKRVLLVFAIAALAWIFRRPLNALPGLPDISDSGIAMAVALLLFLLPAADAKGSRLMDWDTAEKLPWGILLLFGGGLSLATGITTSGMDLYIAAGFSGMGSYPAWLVIALVAVTVILLTELSSNTAVANTFIPVLAAVAAGLGIAPLPLLLAASLAASCAFMLPVATPPNAIVFSSGHLRIADMMRAGIWMNAIAAILVTGAVLLLH